MQTMNNAQLTKSFGNMTQLLEAITQHLGIGESEPKQSAKVSQTREIAAKRSTKGSDVEDVIITLSKPGRIKLPARMFLGHNTCKVDDNTFKSLPSDNDRSAPFSPAIFDAETGDTLVFTHEKGRIWSVSVETGSRKASKKASKPVKSSKRVSDDEDEKPAKYIKGKTSKASGSSKIAKGSAKREDVERIDTTGSRKDVLKRFAKVCYENNKAGFTNENIVSQGTIDGDDAREYLKTPQSRQFRAWRKREGLNLSDAVALLNKYVFA